MQSLSEKLASANLDPVLVKDLLAVWPSIWRLTASIAAHCDAVPSVFLDDIPLRVDDGSDAVVIVYEKDVECGTLGHLKIRFTRAADGNGDLQQLQERSIALCEGGSAVIGLLLHATIGFRGHSINMAHELVGSLAGLGAASLAAKQLAQHSYAGADTDRLHELHNHIYTECRLGLYVVRNFLSHVSEFRYQEVQRVQFAPVDLGAILIDMLDLYQSQATTKGIKFDTEELSGIPRIYGVELELRRLFHNILSNAIKYSYRSTADKARTIRVRTRVPYDPGHSERRFAISFENYGLGLKPDELNRAFAAGFRGRQALAEVPVGSGIGLSEAQKIMKIHRGLIKLRSEALHEAGTGSGNTYLTKVDVIFPYDTRGKE